MPRTRYLAGAITTALLLSASVSATDFSNVIVFGDSLSDGGNIALASGSPVPMRFTTNPGTTTAENVATGLGFTLAPSVAGGTDFAWGGAGFVNNVAAVPTIPQQLQMYLGTTGGKADGNALYQVWGGANDIFYLSGALTDPNAIASGTIIAAQTELGLLGGLQAAGAKYVVVYNLPDLGKTPSAAAGGATVQAGASQLAVVYNGVLNSGLAQLSNNGLNIIPVNTFALLDEVIANPSAYGFSNVTTPACTGGSSIQCGPQGSGAPVTYAPGTDQTYLFADGVHPTTAAHTMLSQYVLSVIHAPEQISLLGEAPLAASATQNRVIRDQMLTDGKDGDTRTFVNIDYGQQRFDASDSSPRTTSDNFNFTLGANLFAGEHVVAGVALGIGQHNADFSGGGGYKLQDISGLGYLGYRNGAGYVGGYVNFGQSNFKDIERRMSIGTMQRTETGKADGSHLGGGLTGGWWFDLADKLQTGPFATLDWQTVKISGYSENGGDSSAMWFGRQQRDSLLSTLGWRLRGQWQVNNLLMSPYVELGWNHDSKADQRMVSAGLTSMNGTFALPGFSPDKSWGTASLGLSAQLTPSVQSWIGYSGRFSDNSQKYNSINMGVRITL